MVADRLGALGELRTLDAMTAAFADEDRCRDVLEALVWPDGAVCPFCSGRNCRRRGGQDYAKGRWRCGEGACRASFTVTSRTPLHATKLPLSVWLKGLWLVLWSDKGVSSPRLAEFLGVTQATAWLLGHRLRLLMRHLNQPLDGTVEADLLQVGGKPRFDPAQPEARKGKQGHTTKRPVLTAVARPEGDRPGAAAATPVPGGGAEDLAPALEALVEAEARLLTDQAAAFATLGRARDGHETVNHSAKEFVRGDVHVNTVEAWHDRFRRTIVGVYHHVTPAHVQAYLDETAFRWRQRVLTGTAERKTRSGKVRTVRLWERLDPVTQMRELFAQALGRQIRRRRDGGFRLVEA